MASLPNKGDTVQFSKLQARPVSLAGMQMKFEGKFISVTGVVAHVRGDHPTDPTSVGVWLRHDETLQEGGLKLGEDLYVTCEKCGKPEVGPIDVKYLTGCTPGS